MLQNPERSRLLVLIGRQLQGRFTADDEVAMRKIVAAEFPEQAAAYSFEHLLLFAKGMVAVNYVLKAMGDDVDVEA